MGRDTRSLGRHRQRVLQPDEQRATGLAVLPSRVSGEANGVRAQLLVELCRALIKLNPSGDVLWLALNAAQKRTSASNEEMALLKVSVRDVASHGGWPEGFYGNL
jgi:hypothetical protein